ncbi:MAG: peptidylprolyl isomerase [Candidatus Scalindua sp.]|nr:peptidylprolyl isomerase [Candidatus Scalindua sp.]
MDVSTGKQVSIAYTLTLEDETVVDSNVGAEPLTFIQGSHKIIPGLESVLDGMEIGDSKQVTVTPEDAYGSVNEDAVSEIEKTYIPKDSLKVGAVLQGQSPDGRVIVARIVEIMEETVMLDYNHPLAGKTLNFDVEILDVQNAPIPETSETDK